MSFNYLRSKATADRLLTKFGQSVTLDRQSRSGYSPVAGMTATPSNYTAILVVLNDLKAQEGETLVEGVTHRGLMSSATAPIIGDTTLVNGQNLKILAVKAVSPAAIVILYDLQIGS